MRYRDRECGINSFDVQSPKLKKSKSSSGVNLRFIDSFESDNMVLLIDGTILRFIVVQIVRFNCIR